MTEFITMNTQALKSFGLLILKALAGALVMLFIINFIYFLIAWIPHLSDSAWHIKYDNFMFYVNHRPVGIKPFSRASLGIMMLGFMSALWFEYRRTRRHKGMVPKI